MFVTFYKLIEASLLRNPRGSFTYLWRFLLNMSPCQYGLPEPSYIYSLSILLPSPRHFLRPFSALFSIIHLLNTILPFCVLYFSSALVWLDFTVRSIFFFFFFVKKDLWIFSSWSFLFFWFFVFLMVGNTSLLLLPWTTSCLIQRTRKQNTF